MPQPGASADNRCAADVHRLFKFGFAVEDLDASLSRLRAVARR